MEIRSLKEGLADALGKAPSAISPAAANPRLTKRGHLTQTLPEADEGLSDNSAFANPEVLSGHHFKGLMQAADESYAKMPSGESTTPNIEHPEDKASTLLGPLLPSSSQHRHTNQVKIPSGLVALASPFVGPVPADLSTIGAQNINAIKDKSTLEAVLGRAACPESDRNNEQPFAPGMPLMSRSKG